MLKPLTESVVNQKHLDYVRKVARELGGRIYSDVPNVKIKFYGKEEVPERLIQLMQGLFPAGSFEIYTARVGNARRIPAVRIRRVV